MRIATKSDRFGNVWHVTIWRGPGRINRWQSRARTLLTRDNYLDLYQWLGQTEPDPAAWIAEHMPWVPERMLAAEPKPAHKWVYGKYATVRPENGRFTVSLDIHGGTRHMRGSHKSVACAIAAARQAGAIYILCAAPGENAGDKGKFNGKPGVLRTSTFSALL